MSVLADVLEAVMVIDAERHLDIIFGLQVVDSSSLVTVHFREASISSSPFHLLINSFSVTCQRVMR